MGDSWLASFRMYNYQNLRIRNRSAWILVYVINALNPLEDVLLQVSHGYRQLTVQGSCRLRRDSVQQSLDFFDQLDVTFGSRIAVGSHVVQQTLCRGIQGEVIFCLVEAEGPQCVREAGE